MTNEEDLDRIEAHGAEGRQESKRRRGGGGQLEKEEQVVNVLERKAEPKWWGTLNAAPGSGLNEVVGSH